MPGAEPQYVSPGFFRSLQIPLIRGRFLDDRDQPSSDKVVVINQAIAERFFHNQDPVGKQIYRPGRTKPTLYTIVGVVADIQHNSPEYSKPLSRYTTRPRNRQGTLAPWLCEPKAIRDRLSLRYKGALLR